MRKLILVLAAAAMVTGMGLPAVAQDAPRRPGRASSGPAGEAMAQRIMDRLRQELNLTDSQETQVGQILRTHHQDLQNWRRENWPKIHKLSEDLQAAMKAGDKDKAQADHQELQKINQSRKALEQNLVKQLSGVLTGDQLEKAKELVRQAWERPGARVLAGLDALALTPDQKEKAKAIVQAARRSAQQASDPQQKREIMKAAFEKVKSDVLTADQRWQLEHMKKFNNFFEMVQSLKLTDDQRKQIQAIRQDTQAQLDKATTPEQKREITRAAFKKIHDTVLTEPQRQQIKQWRQEHARAGGKPTSAPASNP